MDAETAALYSQLSIHLDTAGLPSLGPERRSGTKPQRDVEADAERLLDKARLPERTRLLILGLLLLWHDHLDDAHTIAQAIEGSDGSLLHAIMHRREPDYGNAKYWFRRAGQHPCFIPLAEKARPILAANSRLEARLISKGRWDAFAFVDACEEASARQSSRNDRDLLQQLQKIEAEAFLEYLTSATVTD
jgi:hypothetical protein